MAKNDITGDNLISKANSVAYSENYDRIFGKKDIHKPKQVEKDDKDGGAVCKDITRRENQKVNSSHTAY